MRTRQLGIAGQSMGRFASIIQAKGRGDGSARAEIAKIRTHTGMGLEENPELWDIAISVLSDAINAHNRDAKDGDRWIMPSRTDDHGNAVPTPTERALAAALTIYAAQYGTHVPAPHVPGKPFAATLYESSEKDDKGMARAMHILFSSETMDTLSHRLVSIMPRLKGGFDYSLLADNLVTFQNGLKGRTAVMAEWSRDYHGKTKAAGKSGAKDKENTK